MHHFVSHARRWPACIALTCLAIAGCGGGGGGGDGTPPPPPPPVTPGPPTVTLSAPAGTVNRTTTLSATVNAPSGVTVTNVEFLVDGTVVGSATAAPYSVQWDTSTVSDGDRSVTARVTDNTNRVVNSTAVTYAVNNHPVIHVELSSDEVLPALDSAATAAGDLTVNLTNGSVSGGIVIQGVTATLAHIHRGFAGVNGPVVVDFAADPNDATRWNAVTDDLLSAEDVDVLLRGGLYVNVHSAAHPAGEIRGQIKPANITVVYSPMSNTQVVPAAPDAASGTVAATLDENASTATIHTVTTGLVEPNAAHVHKAAVGANAADALFPLTQSPTDPTRWFVEGQSVAAADITDFKANGWYVDVHTAGAPNGALRGQILAQPPAPPPPPPPPPPPATTLTELQASLFTPVCSGCHSGVGATLPGVMNLSNAAATFAALVDVPSIQQGALARVEPNDPANSYLVRKIEGAPGITGQRMPLGGGALSQEVIDQVRSWINAGAQNN